MIVDVHIVAGQSNALGIYQEIEAQEIDQTIAQYSYIRGSTSKLLDSEMGLLIFSSPQAKITWLGPVNLAAGKRWGPEMTYARTIATAQPDKKIAILKFAIAGSSLVKDWTEYAGVPLTEKLLIMMADIKQRTEALGNTINWASILWVQGEADVPSEYRSNKYYESLHRLRTKINTSTGQKPKWIVMLTRKAEPLATQYATNIAIVRSAQRGFAATAGGYVTIDDMPFSRESHLTEEGYMTLGERAAHKYLELIQ